MRKLIFQSRDLLILHTLFVSRIATSAHLAALHFEGSVEAAKKRLQKLKAEGLVAQRQRKANELAILYLPPKGFVMLQAEGVLGDYSHISMASLRRRADVSELTIRHELEVMDVKSGFVHATRGNNQVSIRQFSTWPALHEFTACFEKHSPEVPVKPDGFIRIEERGGEGASEHTFFLELDRSTETQERLARRARCYLHYYQSGGFAVSQGSPRSAYKEHPFRVLIVLKNVERRNNTAERLLQGNPPILTHTMLSTFEEAKRGPFGPIWMAPVDYRNAVQGTSFDIETVQPSFVYRRQREREELVENRISKRKLLSE